MLIDLYKLMILLAADSEYLEVLLQIYISEAALNCFDCSNITYNLYRNLYVINPAYPLNFQ